LNFTVLPEIAVAKIRDRRAVRQELLHRLRRSTPGVGAVVNTAKVTPGAMWCVRARRHRV